MHTTYKLKHNTMSLAMAKWLQDNNIPQRQEISNSGNNATLDLKSMGLDITNELPFLTVSVAYFQNQTHSTYDTIN